jgi:general secretion pathway protein G
MVNLDAMTTNPPPPFQARPPRPHRLPRSPKGFTMIELIVVLAVIGLLLSLALPHYVQTLERGKAHVQQQDLALMREAIDKFHGDQGRYPDQLEDLVRRRYLRAIPVDPYSDQPDWVVVPPESGEGGVFDVQANPRNRPEPSQSAPVDTDARADDPRP